jgi:calcipressin-2
MDQDSFDSFDDIEEMVMATNNLSLSPNSRSEANQDSLNVSGEEDELPRCIIVTNVDSSVFDTIDIKANFEAMFRAYESNITFHYLRSFRRVRVDFEAHLAASRAKLELDGTPLGDNVIHCYFLQILSPCTDEDVYLHVPPLEKQFLISPPASPPVGWEQPKEDKPVVDYDLLTAMASLSPGENHELHPAKQVTLLGKSISTPSIVVQVCGNEAAELAEARAILDEARGRRIKATPCPVRQNSLD